MKIIKHGIFHQNNINITCQECDCVYNVTKKDIALYAKSKKVSQFFLTDYYTVKYKYYTTCPECGCDNYLSNKDYKILTTDIKDK